MERRPDSGTGHRPDDRPPVKQPVKGKKPLFRRGRTNRRDVTIFLLTAVGITIVVVLVANLIEHYS